MTSVIFNAPPKPPPADVPPLEKPKESEEHLTLRERFAVHRERADWLAAMRSSTLWGSHWKISIPLAGGGNTYDNGREVDSSGQLFREHKFKT